MWYRWRNTGLTRKGHEMMRRTEPVLFQKSCTHACCTFNLHSGTEAVAEGLRKTIPAQPGSWEIVKGMRAPLLTMPGKDSAAAGTVFPDPPGVSACVTFSGLGSGCIPPHNLTLSSHLPPFIFTTNNVLGEEGYRHTAPLVDPRTPRISLLQVLYSEKHQIWYSEKYLKRLCSLLHKLNIILQGKINTLINQEATDSHWSFLNHV